MDEVELSKLETLILVSTNFDTLHRSLPDMLFPGNDPQEQKMAREKQLDVITAWRENLALEENRILEGGS